MIQLTNDKTAISRLSRNTLETNGVRLCTRETTLSEKPLLFCIHGGPGFDSTSLIPGLISLSEQFDLRFVDLRGNGESSEPLDGDYSLDAMTQDILQLILAENSSRVIGVFGHSFGGLLAIRLLAQSIRPLSFGIICSAPFDVEYQKGFSEALELSPGSEVAIALASFDPVNALDSDYRRLSIGVRSLYFPELTQDRSLEMMSSWKFRVKCHRYANRFILPQLDLRNDLLKIESPCLVVGGKLDPIITPRYLGHYAELIQKSTVKVIDGAGHFSFLTQPEQFSKQVSQWWEFNQKNLRGGGSYEDFD